MTFYCCVLRCVASQDCDYKSQRKYNVLRHMALKHGIFLTDIPTSAVESMENDPVVEPDGRCAENQCEYCRKVLSSIRNLRLHQVVCTNKELNYQCNICQRKFSAKSTLSYHKKQCIPSN